MRPSKPERDETSVLRLNKSQHLQLRYLNLRQLFPVEKAFPHLIYEHLKIQGNDLHRRFPFQKLPLLLDCNVV